MNVVRRCSQAVQERATLPGSQRVLRNGERLSPGCGGPVPGKLVRAGHRYRPAVQELGCRGDEQGRHPTAKGVKNSGATLSPACRGAF